MADKNRVPDYEISTYNKKSSQDVDLMELECGKEYQGNKGGADEHSSSTNQQR